jgi:hypothetical protein
MTSDNLAATGQVAASAAEVYEAFFVPALFSQWTGRTLEVALRDTLGQQFTAGIVLTTGDTAYRLDDRIYVVPIHQLWAPTPPSRKRRGRSRTPEQAVSLRRRSDSERGLDPAVGDALAGPGRTGLWGAR